jgi:uncharacterized membrane protein
LLFEGGFVVPYRVLVLLHILGVILFFSNAVAAFFWQWRAHRSRDTAVIAHTFRTLMASDRWITPIAVVIILSTGIAASLRSGLNLLSTGWIFWSLIVFLASGLTFGARVLPLQRDLARWTSQPTAETGFDWRRYRREVRRWSLWAHLSILLALAAVVLMVLRPELAGLSR